MNRERLAAPVIALALAASLVACGDKIVTSTGAPPPPPTDRGGAAAKADAGLPPTAVTQLEYSEIDFVENDRNRDPFRSFAKTFIDSTKATIQTQRKVLLDRFSVDELKLVAIVTGGEYPRAMVVDPAGKGHVIKKGDFIGRAEVVKVGGANGTEYQVNWRVDRVRDGDVVLSREDPAQPQIPTATRVIPLHPEAEPKLSLED